MNATYIIKKIKTGEAYAKNGNLHNPTCYYKYYVYQNNTLVIIENQLKKAKQFIAQQ
jgi:hypothetical protein